MHVPAYELPCYPVDRSCPIAALIFLDPERIGRELAVSSIGYAESAARLYSNGLNQLAHSNQGLSAAARIARSAPSVFVSGGTIEDRVQMVRDIL